MTISEAQRALEQIEAALDRSIEQLVQHPTSADQWPGTLRAAAQALQTVKSQFPLASTGREVLRSLLQSIQKKGAQAHLLLESAALLTFGCLAIASPQSYCYAADGALEQTYSSGRIRLEA